MKYDKYMLILALLRNFIPLLDIEKRRNYIYNYYAEEKLMISS